MTKSLRTLALLAPVVMVFACSHPNYPSLIGKSKPEVVAYCQANTRRYLDNKIMICVWDLHRYLYFNTEEEALQSPDLMLHNTWWVDFREARYSIRRHHLELRFQNGVVISQQPGYTSDL
jgi:hypothetical protein